MITFFSILCVLTILLSFYGVFVMGDIWFMPVGMFFFFAFAFLGGL